MPWLETQVAYQKRIFCFASDRVVADVAGGKLQKIQSTDPEMYPGVSMVVSQGRAPLGGLSLSLSLSLCVSLSVSLSLSLSCICKLLHDPDEF